jgi:hypothetical protein
LASPKGMVAPPPTSRRPTTEKEVRCGQKMDTERTVTRDLGSCKTDSCQKAAGYQEKELHVEYDAGLLVVGKVVVVAE